MKKVLGGTFVPLIALQAVIVEIEAVLNDRPLTCVPSDVSDPEPLTPTHLLYGRRIVSLPYHVIDKGEIDDPSYSDSSGTTLRGKVSKQALLLEL